MPPILDIMIIGVRICEPMLFFIFLKGKNAKISFRLEIKCFYIKNVGFVYFH